MLVESGGLPSDSTCVLKAEPGKLDIKRRKHGKMRYYVVLIFIPYLFS